jgi:penicillin amidase
VPAALFEIFYMKLAENVLADDVGQENLVILSKDAFFYDLAQQPDASWWDDQTTESNESREEILLASIADAVAYLNENIGGDMDDWTWGALHTATFVSDPLGQVDLTAWLVNRGPFPADGGTDLVNASSWRWSDPAAVRGHPSMRMLVDMSDFEASRVVIPTGQSGHPFHEHYDDMIELWLNGEYHPMLFNRTTIEAAAADHLILRPPSD